MGIPQALIGFAFAVSSCSLMPPKIIEEPALTDNDRQPGRLIETAVPEYKYGLCGFEGEYPSKSNCKCDYNQFTFAEDSDIRELKKAAELLWPYAIMSNNAYEEKEKPQIEVPGWRRVNRYKDKKANGKNGGFSADIYESTTSPKRVVIAYRGTDDLQDWKSSLSVGKRRQYAKAEELYDIVRNKYGKNTKIDVTGHSLGGGLAGSGVKKHSIIPLSRCLYDAGKKDTSQIFAIVR